MLEIAVIVSNFLNRCKISTAMPKTAEYSYNDAGQCSIISLKYKYFDLTWLYMYLMQ